MTGNFELHLTHLTCKDKKNNFNYSMNQIYNSTKVFTGKLKLQK